MNTDNTDKSGYSGWLCYDGECRLCVAGAQRFRATLERRGLALAPLQTPWVRQRLGLAELAPAREMVVITAHGQVFGGADAMIYLAGKIWWAWPLFRFAQLPGAKALLRKLYDWLAVRRHCFGTCRINDQGAAPPEGGTPNLTLPRRRWIAVGPLFLAPLLVLLLAANLPAWALMWLLAVAIFAGCKWLTFYDATRIIPAPWGRKLSCLLLWPGMDATAFLTGTQANRPVPAAWLGATLKTVLGIVLLWVVARIIPSCQPLLIGWTGLFGLAFLLHFGMFHLLALAWQRVGVRAEPIMQWPVLATSLSDFWSNRWNRSFNELALPYLWQPLRRGLGAGGATFVVFLISGLIHELVISVPARGGYGLPTAYFLLQGAGVLSERTTVGRRFGLRNGGRGWLWALAFTAGPVFWLFHPPFIHEVILPFLHVIGAIGKEL